MKLNQKNIGSLLVAFSIILVFLLVFVKIDTDKKDAYLCEITHSDPDLNLEECPAHNNNSISWVLVIAFGISFIILVSGVYMIFMPSKKTKEFSKVDLSKLNKEEKKIYNLLKENGGSMYQSDLVKETEFSKVKITRILDKMENKKIIDRKRRGMTNIVVLR